MSVKISNAKINKKDIVEMISGDVGIPVKDVQKCVNSFLDIVITSVQNDVPVSLSGFGRFEMRVHKGHAVALRNGGMTSTDPYKCVRFRASDKLRRSIRNQKI